MAKICIDRVDAIAGIIRDMKDAQAPDFTLPSGLYPAAGDPATADWFFFQCLHQFGFWTDDGSAYVAPLYGTVNGVRSKGAEMLSRILMNRLAEDGGAFSAQGLLRAVKDWDRFLADDDGPAFPDMEHRRLMTAAYAQWVAGSGRTPEVILAEANASPRPLASFLAAMRQVPGFDRDHLEKRPRLLALVLMSRPERLLLGTDAAESEAPIVDYHLMRLALRTGMVELPSEQRVANERRLLVGADVEGPVRSAAFAAFAELVRRSGRPLAVVDSAAWQARRYCPEMEKPKCGDCAFREACAQRVELFQPVRRTDDY